MKFRKMIVIAAAAVLVLGLSAYSTLAYLAAEETAHNVVTSGGVAIELLDKTRGEGEETAAAGSLRDFAAAYPGGLAVLPGTEASKVVAVTKAADSQDCWVRVRLAQEVTVPGEDGGRVPMDPAQYADKIVLHLDENWVLDEEGWYRYNKVLTDADSVTTNLLDGVTFKGPDMGNEFKNSTYTITVQAQAVQAAHNTAGENGVTEDVLTVKGWPQA